MIRHLTRSFLQSVTTGHPLAQKVPMTPKMASVYGWSTIATILLLTVVVFPIGVERASVWIMAGCITLIVVLAMSTTLINVVGGDDG